MKIRLNGNTLFNSLSNLHEGNVTTFRLPPAKQIISDLSVHLDKIIDMLHILGQSNVGNVGKIYICKTITI